MSVHLINEKGVNQMKVHTDEKENYKNRIEKYKDDIARKNRELQKQRSNKKKENNSK